MEESGLELVLMWDASITEGPYPLHHNTGSSKIYLKDTCFKNIKREFLDFQYIKTIHGISFLKTRTGLTHYCFQVIGIFWCSFVVPKSNDYCSDTGIF